MAHPTRPFLSVVVLLCASPAAHAGNHLLRTFDDPTPRDLGYFGSAVAIDAGRVLIAADGTGWNDDSVGQAYLFDSDSGTLLQTFDDPTASYSEQFGTSVALDGNYTLIGTDSGEAHLFDTNTGNLLRTFSGPSWGSGDFGDKVALDGDRVLIGARPRNMYLDSGSAYLFDANTGGLLHFFDDPTTHGGDFFGSSVAIDGDHLLIGSPGNSDIGTGIGQVHLYDANSGNLLHTIESPPTRPSAIVSGWDIAFDGSQAVLFGRENESEYLFLFDVPSGQLEQTISLPANLDVSSVVIDGDHVLAGFRDRFYQSTGSVGQAYLFDVNTGEVLKVFDDPTPTFGDRFGNAVALSGNDVLIGAPADFTNGIFFGQSHLFSITEVEGPIAGDFDRDGDVDLIDYEVWKSAFGSTDPLFADANDDDVINAADYTIWRDSFDSSSASIPEPTTVALISVVLLATASVRRAS